MDIRNNTPFSDGLSIGLGPGRTPCLSVIVKGTFPIPEDPSGAVEPVEDPREVLTEDEHVEDDDTRSLRLEADNIPFKPRADVVVVGCAHVPGEEPARQIDVSLKVGRAINEVVRVFGDRQWVFPSRMAVVPQMTDPVPFTKMPLVYERAFGGTDLKSSKWFSSNPVGRGFIGKKSKQQVDRAPLPNLEDPTNLISSWDDRPEPVGFGFFRKDWQPRAGYVGSVEGQEELDEEFGLPSDFEMAFYNGAHPWLQVTDYLRGDENIDLRHFTPDERRTFSLPGIEPHVSLSHRSASGESVAEGAPGEVSAEAETLSMRLDTLVLLPEEEEFYLVWRGHTLIPELEQSLEQIDKIEIEMDTLSE